MATAGYHDHARPPARLLRLPRLPRAPAPLFPQANIIATLDVGGGISMKINMDAVVINTTQGTGEFLRFCFELQIFLWAVIDWALFMIYSAHAILVLLHRTVSYRTF